jgi:hypothetical protein
MADTHETSHERKPQLNAEAASASSHVEHIGADERQDFLSANDADEEVEERNAQAIAEEVVPPKKKKKPKSKRPKPTGFEEYYTEAPLTPEEYVKERELYDRFVGQASQSTHRRC